MGGMLRASIPFMLKEFSEYIDELQLVKKCFTDAVIEFIPVKLMRMPWSTNPYFGDDGECTFSC
jgi:hypothetical protein